MISVENDEARDVELTTAFKALGDKTRLRIFTFLRTCQGAVTMEDGGDVRRMDGPTVGELCCHLTGEDKVTSVMSFHLKELRNAGLILMERRGRHMVCSVNPLMLDRLSAYLSVAPDPVECVCPTLETVGTN